ncbi:hypothetical protein IVB38_11430 [Bradyrhizobium sp. 38]|uniref:hypothetical protein n=1 Tax=unclassified Bradyrhizobium TaxID=2631580 RepID=UPI001FFA2530|nr:MULTISPECIES: hypothetical protein [unclassified Bradyrhizobium]MCK1336628.1 hypothetical protein [Bradyrhizobium sp. 38]MCK1776978.1 hypothetical protein [Bradyrhizobium sp. 132]
MKKWVTTSWMYQTFGSTAHTERSKTNRWKDGIWEKTDYTTDYQQLQAKLNELTEYCNRHQMSVKALMPLTNAKTHEYGQFLDYAVMSSIAAAGIGHGWAFSNVVGFAALLEHVEEITEEEYERRCGEGVRHESSPPLAVEPA